MFTIIQTIECADQIIRTCFPSQVLYKRILDDLINSIVSGKVLAASNIFSTKMKTIIVLGMVLSAALALPADTYNPEYDNFNAKELVENKRLLKNYAKCFLDKGPCTAEGSDFKKTIPEALRTTCAKCSPKQRELVRTVVRAFQKDLPELWEELVKKEDPASQYTEAFNKFLNSSD